MAHLAHANDVAHRVRAASGDAVQFPLAPQHRCAAPVVAAGLHGAFAPSSGSAVNIIP